MIPSDVVEALMGHEEGLTEVYRRYSTEDLEEFGYRKYPKATTKSELISAMIADLSKDLEPKREVIKLLKG